MMKKLFLSALLMLSAHAVTLQAQTYKLVWADEFDSNSASANWNKEVTENPANNELQYYTNSTNNVRIENGNLVLTGIRETKGSKKFTSGRVNSNGKVYFTHGVVAARIKIPKTKGGLWPAYWMMGNDISQKGWPYCGELDIVEWGNSAGAGREEQYFSAAIHWGADWQQHQYYSYATVNPYSVQDDYHIWICQWTENVMRCYLDDQKEPYFEGFIGEGYGPYPYVHKPSHILFNLAIGGDFPGITDPAKITALPQQGSKAEMLVDWVRIYQLEGKENVKGGENDMNKVPEAERTITLPEVKPNVEVDLTPAPNHDYAMRDVKALFSNQYTNRSSGSFFDTWGSAGEAIKTFDVVEGDQVEEVKNFGYVGFNYNSNYAAISMSTMDYMHCDIYPTKDMSIGITPITQGPQEYDEIYYDIKGNQWNCVDIKLSDFKAANPSMDFSKAFQIKWFGGDGRSTIYLDNIFYYKGEPSDIHATVMEKHEDDAIYDLMGRRITTTPKHGVFIQNNRKIVK